MTSSLAEPRTRPLALERGRAWYLTIRCQWTTLALERHGFTPERLGKLARRVASDGLRRRGARLDEHRFEDLVSRLQMVGLQAALRYDPTRQHASYGSRGGSPFQSYVADLMDRRIGDYFRSKAEGFGDRRYGNDDRLVLTDDPRNESAVDIDDDVLEQLVDERRRARWQAAAEAAGWPFSEFLVITLDRAADGVLRT